MRWTLKHRPEPTLVQHLQETLGIDAVSATLLIHRGITTYEEAKHFFRPELEDLHDPFLMKDMDKAVWRIEKAISNRERILVYGDYDVDGTTSVALMATYLKTRTDLVTTYIPDRYEEGYGVSYKGIDFAEDNGFSLIIALDCGIKAIEKIAYANNKGIDFIVCDHHTPGAELPQAKAILNPKQNDCLYPYKELCGCGVGFKLVQALATGEGQKTEDLIQYLDLVATAIAADIVPITGENRVLTFYGLKVINEHPRTGIRVIIEHLKKDKLTITDVVFIIAPRINAAGRMKHGQHAVTLLTETDINLAAQYAADIDVFNTNRRDEDKRITKEALLKIEAEQEQEGYTTVVYDANWHKGVIGIVASRLIDTYYRPTVVFTKSGDFLTASARSVKGFDLYKALEACLEHIEQFGGHKYAAGLTIKESNYEAFKQQFEQVVSESIQPTSLTPEVQIDMELSLDQITPKFYRILKQLAPFGPGNMTPVFMSSGLQDTGYGKCVGEDDKHLKMSVIQGQSQVVSGIGFNLGDKYHLITNKKSFDATYTIDENHWNGHVSLQLKLKDIR